MKPTPHLEPSSRSANIPSPPRLHRRSYSRAVSGLWNVPALPTLIVALFDEIPECSYTYLSTPATMTHLEFPPTTRKISHFPCVPESSGLLLIGSFNQIPESSCIPPRLHIHHEAHTTPRMLGFGDAVHNSQCWGVSI